MATSFPSGLDALTNPTSADGLNSPDHAGQHADANDAIEALEAKVGVNGSAVTTSLDYKIANGILPKLNVDSGVLVVDATNNRVGVNTASPTQALEVVGTAYIQGGITATGDMYVDSTTFRVDASNNRVGVGTATPSATLDVQASGADAAIRITNTGTGNSFLVEDSASTDTTPFVINAAGLVGIGLTTPTANLDLIGNQVIRAAATQDGIQLAGRAGGTTSLTVKLIPTTLSTNRTLTMPNVDGTVITTGNLSSITTVGTLSAGSIPGSLVTGTVQTANFAGQCSTTGFAYPYTTHPGGTANNIGFRWSSPNVYVSVDNVISGAFVNLSDRRLKTNIEDYDEGLSIINQLRPVSYNPLDVIGFNEDKSIIMGDKPPGETIVGFIADEVEPVAPWVVTGKSSENDILGLNYELLVPVLVNAVKELQARIEILEGMNSGSAI